MTNAAIDMIVVVGPTASGKTTLAVRLAKTYGGEVISADSRQVYRGLDIGAGKDLGEYNIDGVDIPYHLIDIVELNHEFSVFEYQRRFFEVLANLRSRHVLPIVCGGTGLYIEGVLKGYRMVETPENPDLRAELAELSNNELAERLATRKADLHNTTDLTDRNRLIRAIEITEYTWDHQPPPTPSIHPIVLGTRWDRKTLHKRIADRLKARLDAGMIEEVRGLLEAGVSAERLRLLGLEYRFVMNYLAGRIRNKNDLYQKLRAAIINFAKRQETWFRRMERRGCKIHWIPEADFETARAVVEQYEMTHGVDSNNVSKPPAP